MLASAYLSQEQVIAVGKQICGQSFLVPKFTISPAQLKTSGFYKQNYCGCSVSPIHPLKSLRILLRDDATPAGLGLSVVLGIFLGTLPLIGIHSIAILLAAGRYLRTD